MLIEASTKSYLVSMVIHVKLTAAPNRPRGRRGHRRLGRVGGRTTDAASFLLGVRRTVPAIIDKILRIGEGKILRQLETIAKAVNSIEDDFVAMSDDDLRGMTEEFRKRLADGESL